MTYELHPLCTLFPRMAGSEFSALCDDIEANGLRQPIVLHGGMILDGGNRYRACVEVGVEPAFVEFDGGNLVAFVLSANLHRRHMSAGQQAAIVASAQDWANAQPRGGDRKSDQSATLHFDSAASRAEQSGASIRTQKMADKVAKKSPELAREVAHGEKSLPEALREIEPPKPAKPASVSEVDQLRARVKELEASNAELRANLDETLADNESMAKSFEGDDRLGEALADAKKWRAEVMVLRQRVNGLMNEKNEAVRSAKSWQRKAEKVAHV